MVLSILELPNELLIDIISKVPNADFENFTLTCKGIHALATPFTQEHRNRQGLFRRITYGKPSHRSIPSDERTAWTHPTLMLLDLLHDDLLCYPEFFAISDYVDDYPWDDYTDSYSDREHGADRFSGVDDALTSFVNDLKPLIKASPYFDGDEELSRGVLEGDITATLGLLLNVLPNLKTLEIRGYRGSWPGTGSLKRILDSMLAASQNPPRGSIPSLGKLECVVFDSYSNAFYRYDDWNLSTYAPLFYFPSVRYILIHGSTARLSEESWICPGVKSHVNRLEFRGSTINVENLKAYLKTTQMLLHFRYEDGRSNFPGSQIKEVVQTVMEQAGHSLRHLTINLPAEHVQLARAGGLFVGSLKALRVLETLQFEGSMLIEPVETKKRIFKDPNNVRSGRARRLIDILPPSIVRIQLDGETSVDFKTWATGYGIGGDLAAMLQGLPESKADLLPRLEVVAFRLSEPPKTTAVESEMLRACNKAGIKMVIQSDEIWREDLAYVVHRGFYHKGVRTEGFPE